MKYDERAMASCPPAHQIPNYGDWRTPEHDPSNDIAELDKEIAAMELRRQAAKDLKMQARPRDDVIVIEDDQVHGSRAPQGRNVTASKVTASAVRYPLTGIGF